MRTITHVIILYTIPYFLPIGAFQLSCISNVMQTCLVFGAVQRDMTGIFAYQKFCCLETTYNTYICIHLGELTQQYTIDSR